MFSDTRFPSIMMSLACKRQRTKHDIVGYSDDETEEKSKFDGTRKAIIDQIVNSSVKPSPAASHAISKVPVIPSGVVQKELESTTSKGKGLWLRRGRGIDDDDDADEDDDNDDGDGDDDMDVSRKSKKRKKVAKEHRGKPKKKGILLLKDLIKDLETDDDETSDDDDVKDEKEKSKIEKDRLGLIKSRIRKPKRKLMKLLRDLEKDDDEVDIGNLKDLVKTLLFF